MENKKQKVVNLSPLDLRFKEGLDLMAQNQLDAAGAAFTAVLKEKPDHFLALEQIGIISGKLGRHDKALMFLQAVTETAPTYARGYLSLARGLKMAQKFRDAGQALDMCIKLGADDMGLQQDAAHLFLELGFKNKAEATFLRLYELSGSILSMHRFLMHEHKFTGESDPFFIELKKIEKNKKKLKTKDERVVLHYLLSKAYEDMKEYDIAFAHMDSGAAAKRENSPYDANKHVEWLENIQKYYTPPLLKQFGNIGFLTKKPVFIVGMPRCGSTLLDQILASHKGIKSIGESPALPYLIRNHADMPAYDGVSFPITPRAKPYPPEKIGDEYLRQMNAHGFKSERIVDKSLINYAHIGMIKILFPNAKIIHCMRDPMDCCVSSYSLAFGEDGHLYTYDLTDLGKVYCAYRELMDYWHEIFPGAILDVNYEDVVENPEPQVRRVLDFLGMPWDENCLRFYETERGIRSASITQVRQPLYKTSMKKWMKYKKHLGPLVESLGPYAPKKEELT